MIELNIPGRGQIQLQHLVCDVNGTLALDGHLLNGLARPLTGLRDRLALHLLTADTHGRQQIIDQQLNVQAVRIQPGAEAAQKAEYVRRLGAETVIAVGQGANDAEMLQLAAISRIASEVMYPFRACVSRRMSTSRVLSCLCFSRIDLTVVVIMK